MEGYSVDYSPLISTRIFLNHTLLVQQLILHHPLARHQVMCLLWPQPNLIIEIPSTLSNSSLKKQPPFHYLSWTPSSPHSHQPQIFTNLLDPNMMLKYNSLCLVSHTKAAYVSLPTSNGSSSKRTSWVMSLSLTHCLIFSLTINLFLIL